MNTNEMTRKITSLGLEAGRRISYSSVLILLVVAVTLASSGQTPNLYPHTKAPTAPGPIAPDGLAPAGNARVPPNASRAVQPPFRLSSNAPQAQTMIALPPSGKYSFVTITIPNSTYIQPNGISNEGLVVGYYTDENYNAHGFLWKNGAAQTLDYPGATQTYLTGVNNKGVAIGYYDNGTAYQYAVTYSVTHSTWSVLPDIPDYLQLVTGAINDRGVAVGYAYSYAPLGMLSWIWHPNSQSYSYISVPGAREATTFPLGINDDEQVVGSFYTWPNIIGSSGFLKDGCGEQSDENPTEACGYQQINVPGAFVSTVGYGINNQGIIAGEFIGSTGTYGFVRTRDGVLTSVSAPNATGNTILYGINDHGVICGNSYTSSGQYVAFVAYPAVKIAG